MPRYGGLSVTTPLSIPFLIPTQNWGEVVRGKQQDLMYQRALADESEKELVEFQKQRQQFQAEIESAKSLPFLEEDKRRIGMLTDGFEKGIEDKIRTKYNGNRQNYLMQEGEADKLAFKSMLMNSDAFRSAANNKQAMASYMKDREQGRLTMMSNGQTFQDQYADFMAGNTNQLRYNGSYKPSDDFYKGIEEKYGQDKYTRERASNDAILGEIMKRGALSREQAIDQFNQQRLANVPIYYKYDDQYAKNMYDAELAKEQRLAAGKGTGDGGDGIKPTDVVDFQSAVFGGLTTPTTIKVNGASYNGMSSVPGTLNGKTREILMQSIGTPIDKSNSVYAISEAIPFLTEDGTKITGGVLGFAPSRVLRADLNAGKPGMQPYYENYIEGSIFINENQAEQFGIEKPGARNLFAPSRGEIGGSKVIKKNENRSWWGDAWQLDNNYEVKNVRIPYGSVVSGVDRLIQNKDAGLLYKQLNSLDFNNLNND